MRQNAPIEMTTDLKNQACGVTLRRIDSYNEFILYDVLA
jgi:hypothetical protein